MGNITIFSSNSESDTLPDAFLYSFGNTKAC